MELRGLHHVTAVTADAPGNVAFYTGDLGLRLAKKTVNQDDVSAYHLFYADKVGSPGTEMTFFDWAGTGAHMTGRGMISSTAFRLPDRGSLDWWASRLDERGIPREEVEERGGLATLRFADPEGQRLELVHDDGAEGVPGGTPWEESPVPAGRFVRGLDSVELTVESIPPTAALLTDAMGFRKTDEYEEGGHRVDLYEVGRGGPGARVRVAERPDLPPHRFVGYGGVHHVAFRVSDAEELAAWRERLVKAGIGATPVIERYYFRSVYFREPGGVLFELATDGPGFAIDEDAEHLGEKLSLPPFLQPWREEIEEGLKPLPAGARGTTGEPASSPHRP